MCFFSVVLCFIGCFVYFVMMLVVRLLVVGLSLLLVSIRLVLVKNVSVFWRLDVWLLVMRMCVSCMLCSCSCFDSYGLLWLEIVLLRIFVLVMMMFVFSGIVLSVLSLRGGMVSCLGVVHS